MNTKEIVIKYEAKKENLLLILHAIQDSSPNHYISDENIKEIAKLLNTTYAHIYGVVTYYSMFSTKKRGLNIVKVCNSPVCHMKESKKVIGDIEKLLQIKCGETTKDFQFSLEKSECLGICDIAPAIMINQEIYGEVNHEKIKPIIDYLVNNENQ